MKRVYCTLLLTIFITHSFCAEAERRPFSLKVQEEDFHDKGKKSYLIVDEIKVKKEKDGGFIAKVPGCNNDYRKIEVKESDFLLFKLDQEVPNVISLSDLYRLKKLFLKGDGTFEKDDTVIKIGGPTAVLSYFDYFYIRNFCGMFIRGRNVKPRYGRVTVYHRDGHPEDKTFEEVRRQTESLLEGDTQCPSHIRFKIIATLAEYQRHE